MFAYVRVMPTPYELLLLWVGISLSRCCKDMCGVFGVFEQVTCSNLVRHVRRLLFARYNDLGCAVMGVLRCT